MSEAPVFIPAGNVEYANTILTQHTIVDMLPQYFPETSITEENVNQIRQTILFLAIHRRLLPDLLSMLYSDFESYTTVVSGSYGLRFHICNTIVTRDIDIVLYPAERNTVMNTGELLSTLSPKFDEYVSWNNAKALRTLLMNWYNNLKREIKRIGILSATRAQLQQISEIEAMVGELLIGMLEQSLTLALSAPPEREGILKVIAVEETTGFRYAIADISLYNDKERSPLREMIEKTLHPDSTEEIIKNAYLPELSYFTIHKEIRSPDMRDIGDRPAASAKRNPSNGASGGKLSVSVPSLLYYKTEKDILYCDIMPSLQDNPRSQCYYYKRRVNTDGKYYQFNENDAQKDRLIRKFLKQLQAIQEYSQKQ